MARRRKNYRRITVNDQRFRWQVCFDGPYDLFSRAYAENGDTWGPDTLIIRSEDDPRRLLEVTWPACKAPWSMLPSMVADYIKQALSQDWPESKINLHLEGTIPTHQDPLT